MMMMMIDRRTAWSHTEPMQYHSEPPEQFGGQRASEQDDISRKDQLEAKRNE